MTVRTLCDGSQAVTSDGSLVAQSYVFCLNWNVQCSHRLGSRVPLSDSLTNITRDGVPPLVLVPVSLSPNASFIERNL